MIGAQIRGGILASCHCCCVRQSIGQLQQLRNFRVSLIGACGGIGQPLAMLLKMNPLVTELVLHDVLNVNGVGADVSHISTPSTVKSMFGLEKLEAAVKNADVVVITAGMPRRPGMQRDELFAINATAACEAVHAIGKNSAHALIAVVTNPINAIVPMAATVLKQLCAYDPKRLFGVTTLDTVRAQKFIGDHMNIHPDKVQIPIIGGHAGKTIMPIMSQCKPKFVGDEKCIASIINHIQTGGDEVVKAKSGDGSATLSMAFATARFVNALLLGLKGEKSPIECAYVESDLTEAAFFATPLSFGPQGILKNHGLPEMNDKETKELCKAVKELQASIKKGVDHVKN